jgi:hypothetical protein
VQGIPIVDVFCTVSRILIYNSFFFARAALNAKVLPRSTVGYNRAIFQQNEGFASASTMFSSFWLHPNKLTCPY